MLSDWLTHVERHRTGTRVGWLSLDDDGTTTLRGPVTDQAELHGLLAKVRDLGATLISVQATDATDQAGGPSA